MEQGNTIGTITTIESDKRWRAFERIWAVAVLTLMVMTWKLWFGTRDFPAVPLYHVPSSLSQFEPFALSVLVAAAAYIAVARRPSNRVFGFVFVGFCLSFLFNQHRLQPWAYQAALQCLIFALLRRDFAKKYLIALSISIYFFSALGKFDFQFLHTVGQDFVSSVLGSNNAEPSRTRLALAAALPATEGAIAIGLCFAKTRRVSGFAAILMHASLIALLGPWNLAHSAGVVLWNAWLAALAWFLFVRRPDSSEIKAPSVPQQDPKPAIFRCERLAMGIVIASMIMPLFERAGFWDHWLSWSLYSPHTSRVAIQVHEIAIASLPESAKPFVVQDEANEGWAPLEIGRWSLSELGVPVYPQARFQLGVARSLSRSLSEDRGIRVQVRSASDRWTGSRSENWLQGRREIEASANSYLFLGE